jgi:hypothetical protein
MSITDFQAREQQHWEADLEGVDRKPGDERICVRAEARDSTGRRIASFALVEPAALDAAPQLLRRALERFDAKHNPPDACAA